MTRQTRGALLLALAGSFWGFNGLYVRMLANAGLGSLSIVFVRHLCALLMLAPVISAASARAGRNILRLEPRHLSCCVGVGLVSSALGGVVSTYSNATIGVSTTTVLLYTAPVFGCLMSWWLFGESLTRQKLAAIACNFVGVVLVVASGTSVPGGMSAIGLAAGLANGITYALMAVMSRPIAGACHPLAVVYYGSFTVVVALAIPALGSGDLMGALQPLPALAALLYGGLSTVVANMLYQRGMALGVETSKVAVITSVEVAVSACVGAVAFGESLDIAKILGICGVLSSILLMNLHVAPGEVHGVRLVLTAEQLSNVYGVQANLSQAVNDVRRKRESALGHGNGVSYCW